MAAAPQVLLLHGIWNARPWLLPLALRLRRDGWRVASFGYSTAFGGAEAALPRLHARIERMADAGQVALVGHSLGGLIALQALQQAPTLPVTRVVCLAAPWPAVPPRAPWRSGGSGGRWAAARHCCSGAWRVGTGRPRSA
ncbi:alpha/beta fold hydrolase [uncultured Xanthomonas sp.]|uniref:esterase/lipase family protein n=1 Tax=uncultured Xanthomonas sp. TaxID=152831 RepID=UPI0025D0433D|nr:alpha/beta fold hydrolase [uncultured Xanthomonas sp.]